MTTTHLVPPHAWRRFAILALLGLASAPALAVNITIGGVVIKDLPGNASDLDGPGNDTITFNSVAAGGAGFAIPGYVVMGKVKLGGGGAIGMAGFADVVNLTEFAVTRIAAVGPVAPLVIEFGHTFKAPGGPLQAVDKIVGSTNHTGVVNIQWQGSVNGAPIVPQAGPKVFAFGAPAGGANIDPVNGGHGALAVGLAAGAAMTLTGKLTMSLGDVGDVFVLPNSAEVGAGTVPEASSLAMLASGLMLSGAVLRLRARAAGRQSSP